MQDVLVLRIYESGGSRLEKLRAFPVTIGRSVFADVTIASDGMALQQAVIDRLGDSFVVRDGGGGTAIHADGASVASHEFRDNCELMIAGVRIEFLLREPVGAQPWRQANREWALRRVAHTALILVGLYLGICAVSAFKRFGEFWPPERPSEIFTESVAIFAILALVSFFASLLSKLNTRTFSYMRLLCVVTAAAAWFLIFDDIADTLTYNLWNSILRAVFPTALVLCSSLVVLVAILRALFPDWAARRALLTGLMLVASGYGLETLRAHYQFAESDRRAPPVPFGLPLGDPTKGAQSTTELLRRMQQSMNRVQAVQKRVREEIAADETLKGGD